MGPGGRCLVPPCHRRVAAGSVVSAGPRKGDPLAVSSRHGCQVMAAVSTWDVPVPGCGYPQLPAQPCNYYAIKELSLYTRRGCPDIFIFQGWETLSYLRLKPHVGRKRLGVNSTACCPWESHELGGQTGPGLQPLAGATEPQKRTKPPFQPRAAITGRAGHRKQYVRFPSAFVPSWPQLQAGAEGGQAELFKNAKLNTLPCLLLLIVTVHPQSPFKTLLCFRKWIRDSFSDKQSLTKPAMKQGFHEMRASPRPHMEAFVSSALPSSSSSPSPTLLSTHIPPSLLFLTLRVGCKKIIFLRFF